jgi:TIR domain-containing protein/uncharacterized protein DUF2510
MVMTTLQRPLSGMHLRLFISCARADKEALRAVVERLETLHHEIWIDHKLDGGQEWWNEILKQLRGCDAVIIAVSPALLESDAATKEREYAQQLGKPLLPILVAPLPTDLLPDDLAPVPLVDYTNVGPLTGFQLAGALAALPPAPSLPDPLPPPPSVPSTQSAAATVAPGWYPDPSRRHQLRWFDGDWTRYASDFGTVVEDPDF